MRAAATSGMENQELGEWEDPCGAVMWTAEGVCAEAEAGEPWGDVSGVTDILWPWPWPERPRGWVGSRSCIFQWGRINDEQDHFSAFQHGWLQYNSDTALCPDGYCCTSVQGAVRFQGAVGGVASFFLFMLMFSKWAFKDLKLTQEEGMRRCLQVQCFSYPVLFLLSSGVWLEREQTSAGT